MPSFQQLQPISYRQFTMSDRSYYTDDSQGAMNRCLSSALNADAREKITDYCRKVVAFMCTQVGVGGLLVCYTLIGAVGFLELEGHNNNQTLANMVTKLKRNYSVRLFRVARTHNIFNEAVFINAIDSELLMFQHSFVGMYESGYRGKNAIEWTFPSALMFALSIITMVGYGNIVPKTSWGKATTVIYAVFGIPLYILYFLNMGEILSGSFRIVYTWLYECSTVKNEDEPPKRIIVPSTACLWVMAAYILTGTIMFANWEKWSYMDSAYFCVTSLCKLGFGDFIPGANIEDSKGGNYAKLIINFIYMLGGLGLVAMCYNLMKEQIRVKVTEISEDINQCLEDTKTRFVNRKPSNKKWADC